MDIIEQIKSYISSLPNPKGSELKLLHDAVINAVPGSKLWFLDGKNSEGKVVSNPNIGYGECMLNYADGSSKTIYRVGLSANTTGISVYIMGLKDKNFLKETYGNTLGKANITGYCIKFKKLGDVDMAVLMQAIHYGLTSAE
jgi:hypothetical protein